VLGLAVPGLTAPGRAVPGQAMLGPTVLGLALLLGLASAGSAVADAPDTETTTAVPEPLAPAMEAADATVPDACRHPAQDASRIAIAGGSLTEIVYLLGEQARIVGADRTSNYPQAALALPQIGYVRALSAEGVLSLKPTLVLGEHDMGPPEVIAQLERTGVEMVRVPEVFTPAGIAAKIRCVANVLGRPAAGEALIAERVTPLIAEIDAVRDAGDGARVAVLLGLRDGAPLGAGADTSGHGLLAMAGVANALSGMSGWKPVSMETMVSINPQVFIVPERGVNDAGGIEGLLSHPALRLTQAGREQRVITMDGMAMLGFGPRTLEAARDLAVALSQAHPAGAQARRGQE
jgi:iron complex transport system substrate-binding protein